MKLTLNVDVDDLMIIDALQKAEDHNYYVFDGVVEILNHIMGDHYYMAEQHSLNFIQELEDRGYTVSGEGTDYGRSE